MNTRAEREDRGAAAVEFALVAGILFTLIFGTIQYGLYFWSLQSGAQAAREAARQAAVGSLDCDDFEDAVLTNSRGERDGSITATRTYYDNQLDFSPARQVDGDAIEIGHTVRVEVKFDSIDLGLPFVPFIDGGRVEEHAVARVENITDETESCS